MASDDVPCTPLGAKALDILEAANLGHDDRAIRWLALEQQYSAKAIRRKFEELVSRGYLDPTAMSWLTVKGRRTLETSRMVG